MGVRPMYFLSVGFITLNSIDAARFKELIELVLLDPS